jgi:hypothetical protein
MAMEGANLMSGDFVKKRGIDVLGRNYTRDVKAPTAPSVKNAARTGAVGAPTVSSESSVSEATGKVGGLIRTQPPARVRLTRNNPYIDSMFAVDPGSRQFESLDTTREVGVRSVVNKLQECARDNLGRELTRDELETIVDTHLWDTALDGGIDERGRDSLDFHVIDNISAVNAFEAVRKLGSNYMDY